MEDLYDSGNLYHSIEYAQYDYLQRGQHTKAEEMLSRMESIIDKLGGADNWSKTKNLIWIQQRMAARQYLESFGADLSGWDKSAQAGGPLYGSLLPGDVTDGEMNYAAISELGMLLVNLLRGLNLKSRLGDKMVKWALNQARKLELSLKSRPSVFEYTRHMSRMMRRLMLGLSELTIINQNVYTDKFDEAVRIQKTEMVQSSATPTLLYSPSYEVSGYCSLLTGATDQARRLFEASLGERMGRTLSLLGLARAHSLLGHSERADFFYQYLRDQLRDADEDNLALMEAVKWANASKLNISSQTLRKEWFWPSYLTHFSIHLAQN